MASKSNPGTAIAIGGLVALGLLALGSSGRQERRRGFHDYLREALAEYGLHLVNAELGRRRQEPVWVVTVEGAHGVFTVHVGIESEQPYSDDVARAVAHEVARDANSVA